MKRRSIRQFGTLEHHIHNLIDVAKESRGIFGIRPISHDDRRDSERSLTGVCRATWVLLELNGIGSRTEKATLIVVDLLLSIEEASRNAPPFSKMLRKIFGRHRPVAEFLKQVRAISISSDSHVLSMADSRVVTAVNQIMNSMSNVSPLISTHILRYLESVTSQCALHRTVNKISACTPRCQILFLNHPNCCLEVKKADIAEYLGVSCQRVSESIKIYKDSNILYTMDNPPPTGDSRGSSPSHPSPNSWRQEMQEYNERLEKAGLEALTPERFDVIFSTMTGQTVAISSNSPVWWKWPIVAFSLVVVVIGTFLWMNARDKSSTRRQTIAKLASLSGDALVFTSSGATRGQNDGPGLRFDDLNLGFDFGSPPRLAIVEGTNVYSGILSNSASADLLRTFTVPLRGVTPTGIQLRLDAAVHVNLKGVTTGSIQFDNVSNVRIEGNLFLGTNSAGAINRLFEPLR